MSRSKNLGIPLNYKLIVLCLSTNSTNFKYKFSLNNLEAILLGTYISIQSIGSGILYQVHSVLTYNLL